MNTPANNRPSSSKSRREFLELSGSALAASALAGVTVPRVHAVEDSTIRLGLVGCGGRGTGAVGNAFATAGGPVKLVAMADLSTRLHSRELRRKCRLDLSSSSGHAVLWGKRE